MKPAPVRYLRPDDLEQACTLLAAEPDAKVIAGGQSLVPLMNFRLAIPSAIVDIGGLPDLATIRITNDAVEVDALVTQRTLERDADALAACPLLTLAIPYVGHTTTRNRGTVCGSIAHADAAAELPCVLRCLDGEVDVQGATGGRTIQAADLFVGHLTSALAPDEIITVVRFPRLGGDWRFAFRELAQRHGDYAMAMVALAVRREGTTIAEARLTIGAVADRPLRLPEAEEALTDGATPAEVGALAAQGVDPIGSPHAPADYRRALVEALTRRAVEEVVAA